MKIKSDKMKKDMIIIKELTEDEYMDGFFYTSKVSAINAIGFVWDECHKIYIVEDEDDIQDIKENWNNATIYSLEELPKLWSKSCPLRFISNWRLDKHYVSQCSEAMFEFPLWEDK